jgi:hypothetical protein
MINIIKRTEFVYEIEAKGFEDLLGDSTITGILILKGSGLRICFDKLYNDRNRAGQTGKWDLLIFEGEKKGGCFEGEWYY